MRRLARHLFTLCSAVALLLCVAVCVLWVRSWLVSDWVTWLTASRTGSQVHMSALQIWTGEGNALAAVIANNWRIDDYDDLRSPTRRPIGWSWEVEKVEDPAENATIPQTLPRRLGFSFRRHTAGTSSPYSETAVTLPLWLPALLLTLLPMLAFRAWLRHRRLVFAGLCPTCGYDRRASPERCPECGTGREPPES